MSGKLIEFPVRSLDALSQKLGRGPANLLARLAIWPRLGNPKWTVGPLPARRISEVMECPEETLRRWRNNLIDAGLIRVTMPPGKNRGCVYELLGMENFPISQGVREYLDQLYQQNLAATAIQKAVEA